MPQTKKLTQQKSIFSQFWRLEVQDQGASSVGFQRDLSSWLADNCCFLTWPFLCADGSVQSLSRVRLFATPSTSARQASLSFTISQSLLKLMSIESVMPSNHLILWREGKKGGREWERLINWSVVSSTSCKDTSPIGLGPFSYDLI